MKLTVAGNMTTPCNQERKPHHIITLPFDKYVLSCLKCKSECVRTVEPGGTLPPTMWDCEKCEGKTHVIYYDTIPGCKKQKVRV